MSDVAAAASVRAPHKLGTTEPGAVQKQATSSASTAAVAIGNTGNDISPWYTFVCDQDCYIAFGDAAVGVATADEWPFKADVPQSFALTPKETHFRVIRKSADGTLKWYPSGGTR